MPNQHKNPMIAFHPDDPTLKPWVEATAEAEDTSLKAVAERALSEYRARAERTVDDEGE